MKAKSPRQPSTRIFALGAATLFVVAACYAGARASSPPTESGLIESTSTPPAASPSSAPSGSEYCGSASWSIDYMPYSAATLVGFGYDFVVADVISLEASIVNTPDGGLPPGIPAASGATPYPEPETLMIYRPVNVMVDDVISGPTSVGPRQLLVEGGTVGCYTVNVDQAPAVEPGSRYVLILSEALDPQGRNPMPLQKIRFAWPFDADGIVRTVDGPMSLDELAEIVERAAESPGPNGTALPEPEATTAAD